MRRVITTALALSMFVATGCSLMTNDNTDTPDNTDEQVQPDNNRKYPAAEHWGSLANLIENGMIRHTDEILWIADHLKTLGHVEDLSRVDKYRAKREILDDSNRAYEANHIRGGN